MITASFNGATVSWNSATGDLRLRGDLTGEGLLAIRDWGEKQIAAHNAAHASVIRIDLAELASASSQVLSLVLCWIRLGQASGKKITVTNASNKLRELAKVSGLDALLLL